MTPLEKATEKFADEVARIDATTLRGYMIHHGLKLVLEREDRDEKAMTKGVIQGLVERAERAEAKVTRLAEAEAEATLKWIRTGLLAMDEEYLTGLIKTLVALGPDPLGPDLMKGDEGHE